MAAGAGTRHLDKVSVSLPVTQPWDLKAGLLVNAQGQRFINEDAYYGRLGDNALLRQDGRCWLIVDDTFYVKPDYGFELAAVGETPKELEEELGFPLACLMLRNRNRIFLICIPDERNPIEDYNVFVRRLLSFDRCLQFVVILIVS